MLELKCHYCTATVAVIRKGGSWDKNAVHLCGECARQRHNLRTKPGPNDDDVVENLMKMMGMK